MKFLLVVILIAPIVSAYKLQCENGTSIQSVRSFFVESKRDRVFYNHTCQNVPGGSTEESCTETLVPDSYLQAKGIWSVRCTGNGYITGMEAIKFEAVRQYRFFCCANPSAEYLPATCHRRRVNAPGEYFELYLEHGEAIRGVRSIYDSISQYANLFNHFRVFRMTSTTVTFFRDRSFLVQVCSFRGNTVLKQQVYSVYSLSQTIPFGDVLSSYNYDITCPTGAVATRFDSLWSDQNQDRVFAIECSQVASSPIQCSHIRYIHADGAFPENHEIYVPTNWTVTACEEQEALYAWRSAYMDDIRRYRFGCCVLEHDIIDTSTCYWKNANSEDSYVMKAPPGWVFRGISARFQPGWRDRLFRFELCQLSEYASRPKCGIAYEHIDTKALQRMSQVFMHTGVNTAQDCAMACTRHPFCLTAGFQPAVVGQDPVCFYSYRKSKKACPSVSLVYGVEGTKPVWIYCAECRDD